MSIPGVVKLTALWESLRTSYWFVPTVMAVTTVGLSIIVHAIDARLGDSLEETVSWIFTGGPEGARELLSVAAGSMITIAGVTFSITIVALTLASQQYGPFLLRNFMRDTGNQVVLGTFISTFIFCLLTLRMVRGTDAVTVVPQLSVSVAIFLAMCSLGVLIYFIHHVSAFIQASNIISAVSRDLELAIDRLFPERIGMAAAEEASQFTCNPQEGIEADTAAIPSAGYGYIKAVDGEKLLKLAVTHDLVVSLLKKPGDFVGEGDIVALLSPGPSVSKEIHAAFNDSLVVGPQRTATQDVEFVFHQIVEVAVRSLSPGINDPFTAVICIDHLGQGLRKLAGRAMPSPFRFAEDGALRIIACPVTFSEITDSAFSQIRHYGSSSLPVLIRLLRTIEAVAGQVTRDEDRRVLLRHCALILEAGLEGLKESDARSKLKERQDAAIRALQ